MDLLGYIRQYWKLNEHGTTAGKTYPTKATISWGYHVHIVILRLQGFRNNGTHKSSRCWTYYTTNISDLCLYLEMGSPKMIPSSGQT